MQPRYSLRLSTFFQPRDLDTAAHNGVRSRPAPRRSGSGHSCPSRPPSARAVESAGRFPPASSIVTSPVALRLQTAGQRDCVLERAYGPRAAFPVLASLPTGTRGSARSNASPAMPSAKNQNTRSEAKNAIACPEGAFQHAQSTLHVFVYNSQITAMPYPSNCGAMVP